MRATCVDEFKTLTAEKLRGVECPRHRQAPKLKFHGATMRDVTIQMSGCCAKLIAMANQKIAGTNPRAD